MAKVFDIQYLKDRAEKIERKDKHKVCIVGIIGHCNFKDKDALCNILVGKQVFNSKNQKSSNGDVLISIYHDAPQRIIYLQLVTAEDPTVLVGVCKALNGNISLTRQHQYWQSNEHRNFASLLFIFSVCHIVVVAFPTPRFDLAYLRLFKTLASARHNMLHHICGALSGIEGIPEIWKTTGRPCIPRIIFIFQVPWMKEGAPSNESTLLRIQSSLQEQVHLILRKNRQLGSLSSSSLFTVSSPNPAFVYVQPSYMLLTNPVKWCLDRLIKHSVNLEGVYRSFSDKVSQSSILSQPSQSATDEPAASTRKNPSFQEFVNKQIDYMMTVESREVPAEGRRGTHVEAPYNDLWYRVCAALYELFLGNKDGVHNHLKNMASSLDYDWKFSENRCLKVIPLATNAYLDNLPSHYTHSVHLSQLNKAFHVYSLNTRGPAFEHYMGRLQEDCNQIWWSGRQLCEIQSLTGQPCVYPFHRIPVGERQEEESAGIPCKPHSSRVTSIAACNCGRMQGTREDPFDLKVANFEFYQDLEKKCCSYLVHMEMLTCSTRDAGIVQDIKLSNNGTDGKDPSQLSQDNDLSATDSGNISQMASSMGAMTLSSQEVSHLSATEPAETASSVASQRTSEDTKAGDERSSILAAHEFDTNSVSKVTDAVITVDADTPIHNTQEISRESSTIEYLDNLVTEDTAPELVPLYSSWSLICLGPATLYNPNKGVEQQGFFSGSNFLLPFEIRITEGSVNMIPKDTGNVISDDSKEHWPSPGEASKSLAPSVPGTHLPIYKTAVKLMMLSKDVAKLEIPETVVKASTPSKQQKGRKEDRHKRSAVRAYIGNEYECPRGHRFICSAPDRIVKSSGGGHLRDTASKLIHNDMPLYFPCPCRSAKPLQLAQLMRSYIVTPDSQFGIRINPRVQPGDNRTAPVFIPGPKHGIALPKNSFCVLRFPYVYMDDTGPYLPPIDSQSLLNFRLLKDMYSFEA